MGASQIHCPTLPSLPRKKSAQKISYIANPEASTHMTEQVQPAQASPALSKDFIYTTAIKKMRDLSKSGKRIKVVCGGSSAGKTFGILPIIINKAIKNPRSEISVVAESVPHLRRGAMKDFEKIMRVTGRWQDAGWNATLMKYKFSNGSYIEFFSADDDGKVRGPRRTDLYINECNNIKYETFFQLNIRTSGDVWLDYNPVDTFWVDENVLKGNDVTFVRLTYKDNEALPDSIVRVLEECRDKAFYEPLLPEEELFADKNIKSTYWSRWWKVYGMGYQGTLEGVIFQHWESVEGIPPTATLMGYGLDFGFANDPTALVGMWKHGKGYYFKEMIYEKGLTNRDIANRIRDIGIDQSALIIADSAEPKSIEELRQYGIKGVRKAKKGKDSILQGITLMLANPMFVTNDSMNMIKELRSYSWEVDKNGSMINRPSGGLDHSLDASRYISMAKMGKIGGFVVSSGKVVYSDGHI